MNAPPLSEAFLLIGELAEKLGVTPLINHPGLWTHSIPGIKGGTWRWALNAHQEALVDEESGVAVEFAHCFLQWSGWPAGMLTPYGGWICSGEAANEGTFIAALKQELERLSGAALRREREDSHAS